MVTIIYTTHARSSKEIQGGGDPGFNRGEMIWGSMMKGNNRFNSV